MIPENIKLQISDVKELKVANTSRSQYAFDPKINTLYIPISETDFSYIFSRYHFRKITFCIDNLIEYAESMFNYCYNLNEIIFVKKLNLENVHNLKCMFYGCNSLEKIDLSNMLTSNKLKYLIGMFHECNSLKEVNFGNNFHSENITHASGLFFHCYNLETIHWNDCQSFYSLTCAHNLFNSCKKLKQIDLRGINFNKLEDSRHMFTNTSSNLKVLVNNTFREDLL